MEPFKIAVSDDVLADLKFRLEHARYPQELNLQVGEEWSYGTPVNEVKELVEYWKTGFDWRSLEADLNANLPQFMDSVETGDAVHGTMKIHFAHKRSTRSNAVMKIAEELVEPTDPKHPAFHLVSPSIPGYGFSEAPTAPGFGVKRTAAVFDNLMKRLGYTHYLAQGGDWGATIARALAVWHHESCKGIATNMLIVYPKRLLWHPIMLLKILLGALGVPGGYSSAEMGSLAKTYKHLNFGTAYEIIQKQRPQVTTHRSSSAMFKADLLPRKDSPTGLLAWILEKLHSWTDNYQWTKDEILLFVMLNWIPGPAPSFRFYNENLEASDGVKDLIHIQSAWSPIPMGVSIFESDIYQFPDDFGSVVQPLKYVKRHSRGGHFAAWETPEILLGDIREFAKIVVADDPTLISKPA
ncbi:hypothetical protein FRB96_007928 [Tulasnella sp. 330]|nr:hypothetical protein FRB96_007928 [Tulasnella sp. 330]KAG8878879.1 hypothetical protein FRB98_005932 [Tulasnella sp. 332]